MKAILHLTFNCNLRCRYCYVGEKREERMAPQTALAAVDLVLAHSQKTACISFFGGEPLIEMPLVREVVAQAEARAAARKIFLAFRMSTNGLLLDEGKLAFLRDHRVFFALSFDGTERSHDANRLRAGGQGSFKAVDAKVEMILRYQPQTVVVAVVNQANAAYLSESVAYLFGRGFRFIVTSLDYSGQWTAADLKVLKREYKKVAAFYIEEHRAGRELYFNVFDEKIKTHALGPNRRGEICDLGRETFSVAPDGDLFPCVQFVSPEGGAYRIGDVLRGFDEEKRQALIRENLGEREQCTGCALEGRCNNWCGCLNWKATGSIRRVPPILCEHERLVTPIADRIGKVLYRERNGMFMRKHYREGVPGPH